MTGVENMLNYNCCNKNHLHGQENEEEIFSTDTITSDQIHYGIKNNQFTIHYQPQVDLITGRVTGLEALIRWQHPKRGLLYPDNFIDLVEQSQCINCLGDYIIEKSCEQANNLHLEGLTELKIGVNISPNQFENDNFVDNIKSILKRTKLNPKFLELEITEHIVIHPTKSILDKINSLKEIGVRFSIDDFGTGYSSLAYLRDFPFDTLKIDRSFINNMERDVISSFIVESMIYLGEKLKLRVIAEGVETESQALMLKRLGLKEIQGYLFSKPLPIKEIKTIIKYY